MLNRTVLIGRLCADPEVKYTPAGVQVATFRLAVNRITKNEAGEYDADFFNIVAWRRTAEFVGNYLTKGRLVSIEGRLQTRSWVAQDGTKRSTVEIVADNVEGLDKKSDAAGSDGGGYNAAPAPAAPSARQAAGAEARVAVAADEADMDETDPFADE